MIVKHIARYLWALCSGRVVVVWEGRLEYMSHNLEGEGGGGALPWYLVVVGQKPPLQDQPHTPAALPLRPSGCWSSTPGRVHL